jgi:hypothetical protein
MKTVFLYLTAVVLLALLLLVGIHGHFEAHSNTEPTNVFIGVDASYDNMESLKLRVDGIKSYTNFFIIGSTGITFNETKLNELCQYIYDSGLYFSIFSHTTRDSDVAINQSAWSIYAAQRWGNHFWGLYTYDEPGGHQVDHDNQFMAVKAADNYSDAANKFISKLHDDALLEFIPLDSPLMTSDYALYEFDYSASYDVVLTELAWNHSRPINIALCRGAATAHRKDWGVMITYTYDNPPYLASGAQIYDDLVLAYENGAKYFLMFDYAKDPETGATHGILQQEHLDALQRFWQYVKRNPKPDILSEKLAYVLPKDYAYGFRGPIDNVWGLWGHDDLSSKIWNDVNMLVNQYGSALDITYGDTLQNHAFNYSKLVFWNGTVIEYASMTKSLVCNNFSKK